MTANMVSSFFFEIIIKIATTMDRTTFERQLESISQMSQLPPHLRDVIVENKKMAKKIVILQSQLHEKNGVIRHLKEQLDSAVVEQTQERLILMRNVEQKVEERAKDVKQKYFEKSLDMKAEIDVLRETVEQLRRDLSREVQRGGFLVSKIQSLKQYILQIVEEKDYLIKELGDIINEQERKITSCSFCSKLPEQICHEAILTKKQRKRPPAIRKNQ